MMPGISVPYPEPLALMLPAPHLAPGITAVRAGQSALLKAEACAGCISHMHRCSILTSAQHLHARPSRSWLRLVYDGELIGLPALLP